MRAKRKEEIEQRLTTGRTPRPPDGLLERLHKDIPQGLSYENIARVRPAAPGWQRSWAVAASVLVLVSMSYVMLRVAQLSRRSENAESIQTDASRNAIPSAEMRQDAPRSNVSLLPPVTDATSAGTSVETSVSDEADRKLSDEAKNQSLEKRAGVKEETQSQDAFASELEAYGKVSAGQGPQAKDDRDQMAAKARSDALEDFVEGKAVEGADEAILGGVVAEAAATPVTNQRQVPATAVMAPRPQESQPAAPSPSRRMERERQATNEVAYPSNYGGGELVDAEADPVSSFGLRVATGSFKSVKRSLDAGTLPPPSSVHVEELVNYFDRDGRGPVTGDFAIAAEGAPVPLSGEKGRMLLRIAVRARDSRQAGSEVVARSAKASVEFDPLIVAAYRLIGYEDGTAARALTTSSDIPAGHTVVALYEIQLQEPLDQTDRVATVRLHYRKTTPRGKESTIEHDVRAADFSERWESASSELKLVSLVAKWGEILKKSSWAQNVDPAALVSTARLLSQQSGGNRALAEFVALTARTAKLLQGE